ncbi:MAG: class I SAM-dependent methyltransferase [Roseivivax sp.]|nr:class I SAM-dependent methyltransferase [Roseivivax sp.]
MDIKAVETAYARWAPVYDKTFGAITEVGRRRTVGYVNAHAPADVLELGVGTGLALRYYSKTLRVTGIDYSTDMLRKAKKRVAEDGLSHIHALMRMDARALSFEDASFDFVVSMHVLSVVPEPERVMAEIARVLRPGGRAVIAVHFKRDSGALAVLERAFAPLADLIGWHSDFDRSAVLAEPALTLVEEAQLPPMGMMTFMVLERRADRAVG